ncbi:snaclec 5-like [Myxocyprinus asiaticus]|uniref:snaclec 5-like n=1 Tax=Myxocyprinus asiaticus TaxID=70543 RepID=UPI00222325D5|nr:snaclec 5-like [Myxocyprinus asiaticus]
MKTTVTVLLFFSLSGLNTSVFRKHYYVKQSMAWNDAQTYCRVHYDDLSTVSSQDLEQFSENTEIIYDYYWIGLQRDAIFLGQWKWSAGGVATINEWFTGEPSSLSEKYVSVHKNLSKMFDSSCSESKSFYCMEVYELILMQQNKTWEEALDYCRQHYTDLASLNSDGIMEKAMTLNTAAQTDDVWTGLRFLAGRWFWVKGDDLQYKAWSVEGEPQCPAMNQHCGALKRNEKVCNPKNCEERLNFLCA